MGVLSGWGCVGLFHLLLEGLGVSCRAPLLLEVHMQMGDMGMRQDPESGTLSAPTPPAQEEASLPAWAPLI